MKETVTLNNTKVKNFSKPYFIAEVSANHLNDINRAMQIINEASKSGAQAIKLQTYTADTMTLNSDIMIENGTWKGENLYKLYEKAQTPWEWHEKLFKYTSSLGMDFLSTPFDETAVDFLETLKVSFYKVASFEINHFPLLERLSKTKKPLILSTGMSSFEEIEETIRFLKLKNVENIVLLHCVSG